MRTPRTTLLAAAACVALAADRAAADGIDLPGAATLTKVDFERHVMGLLSKAGCNSGSCHGSFQGKNGFRLSLFGYEPAFDNAALTRDNLGRRVDVQRPENSLLLLKATGAVTHDGGMRFGKGSWMYEVVRRWIADGATHVPGSGEIAALTVTPPDFAVVADGRSVQVKVTAAFADGTAEDVTPFCDFKVSDDAVAAVSATGQVTPRQPGDVGLTVLYRGAVRAVRVLVPAPGKVAFPDAPSGYVDREVLAKLKLLNMAPSGPSGDLEFLRRVTIDTIGLLPSPEEARAFLSDGSPDKRERKIDELLAHPLHAALWATKLSDITGNNTDALEVPQQLRPRRSQMWHDWLRKRVADNQPYDELARDILTATSRDGMGAKEWLAFVNKIDAQMAKGFDTDYADKRTLDLFWRRQQRVPVEQWGEKVAAAFLGVRLECAQCHKHPTDRWTQADYWGFANLFAPVVLANNQFSDRAVKKAADAETTERREKFTGKNKNQTLLVREMFFDPENRASRLRPITGTNRVVQPKALGGPTLPHHEGADTRAKLWEWMRDPANPFFARSFVNRVWAHYFGVGLVDPVDDFSQANPPTNPRLLDALARDFVQSGYDIRRLERTILTSRTYQRSAAPTASNKFDRNNFARSYVRPLMAEQVVDVLNAAVGVDEEFGNNAPDGRKMTEVGASRLNGNLSYVLRIFGRPPRTTACDCERAMEPALPQTLFRMTDPTLMRKLQAKGNRTVKLARSELSNEQAVEELFLATLTRPPTANEKDKALEYMNGAKNRAEGLQEVMWALINTREFILNH
ncbi:MAG TPA: DUF1549 and DUF1553 domain-containing protein [Fimbriiglobus sp.]|nr:DUF1549 and DUF1553 domain-containing protein [Fimbriiglobus sp.]